MNKRTLDEILIELNILKQNSKYDSDMNKGFLALHNSETVSYYHGENGSINVLNMKGNSAYIKLQSLLLGDLFIYRNYSDKEVKNFIVKLISIDNLSYDSLQSEIELLKKIKSDDVMVFLPVYGIEISDTIRFGNFTFHNKKSFKKRIAELQINIDVERTINEFGCLYFIEGTVKTRSRERAIEIFQERTITLMNIIRFFVNSRDNSLNLNITRESVSVVNSSLVIDIKNGKSTIRKKRTGSLVNIELENIFFSNNKFLNLLVSNQFDDKKTCEIERRVSLAIQWIGESLDEHNKEMKFLKIFFAFEAVLQIKGENQTEKMSDLLCFLLKHNKEERLMLKREFKKLYNVRSRIAHGEVGEVTKFDIICSYDLVYGLIYRIWDDFNVFKTLEDVNKCVDELKYS